MSVFSFTKPFCNLTQAPCRVAKLFCTYTQTKKQDYKLFCSPAIVYIHPSASNLAASVEYSLPPVDDLLSKLLHALLREAWAGLRDAKLIVPHDPCLWEAIMQHREVITIRE